MRVVDLPGCDIIIIQSLCNMLSDERFILGEIFPCQRPNICILSQNAECRKHHDPLSFCEHEINHTEHITQELKSPLSLSYLRRCNAMMSPIDVREVEPSDVVNAAGMASARYRSTCVKASTSLSGSFPLPLCAPAAPTQICCHVQYNTMQMLRCTIQYNVRGLLRGWNIPSRIPLVESATWCRHACAWC